MKIFQPVNRFDGPATGVVSFLIMLIGYVLDSDYIITLSVVVFFITGFQLTLRPSVSETDSDIVMGIICMILSGYALVLIFTGN